MDKGQLVLQQPNVITQARYSFSEYEMRVLLFVVRTIQAKMNREGMNFNRDLFGEVDYKIHFLLSEMMVNEDEKNHGRIRKALKELRQRDFEVENEKAWFNVGFINYSYYRKDLKKYELQVSHLLMPYMLSIAEGYTEYQLSVVLRLNSHTQRLYMMMSQFNDTGFFIITADDLRFKLGLEKSYNRYCDFKVWVIKKSEKELKELYKDERSDLYFTLVDDKKKRNGIDDFDRTLKFKVTTTDQKSKSNEAVKTQYITICTDLLKRIYPEKENLIKSIFNHLFKVKRIKEFTDRIFKIEEQSLQEGKPLHNYGGLVTHILRDDFNWEK